MESKIDFPASNNHQAASLYCLFEFLRLFFNLSCKYISNNLNCCFKTLHKVYFSYKMLSSLA